MVYCYARFRVTCTLQFTFTCALSLPMLCKRVLAQLRVSLSSMCSRWALRLRAGQGRDRVGLVVAGEDFDLWC